MIEQREIVRRIKSFLAMADQLEHSCRAAQGHVGRAVPAILAAFRGDLVPQESSLAAQTDRTFESGADVIQRARAMPPRAGRRIVP